MDSNPDKTASPAGSRRSARRKLFEALFLLSRGPELQPEAALEEVLGYSDDPGLAEWLRSEAEARAHHTFVIDREPEDEEPERITVRWWRKRTERNRQSGVVTEQVEAGPAEFPAAFATVVKRRHQELQEVLLDLGNGWEPELLENEKQITLRLSRADTTTPVTDRFTGENLQFIRRLARWVHREREALDGIIAEYSDEWRVERLGASELVVLRLAVAELLLGEIDSRVVINEAVDLTKMYAERESHKFVNGVLGGIERDLEQVREHFGELEGRET